MNVIKICLEKSIENIGELLQEIKGEVHVQKINNTPYLKWLSGLQAMKWQMIVDVFREEPFETSIDLATEFVTRFPGADIYVAEDKTYKEPVNRSEIITSCYFWNYVNSEEYRIQMMNEHFLMEQRQVYYDYVSFQSVRKCVTDSSTKFDFFFESHVSNPNGINEIYSKPALENMREHSKAFLDVGSRCLSFGNVEIKHF